MELQELVVRAVTVQMRFRLAPAFADVRGEVIERLRDEHELSEYGWSEGVLQVMNTEQTKTLVVGSRELRISYEHLARLDDFRDAARRFFEYGLATLRVDSLEFLGVRSYWLAAVDSFEELRDGLGDWLTPANPVSAAVAAPTSDVGWVFEYQDQSPEYLVRLGPMRVEQLLGQGLFATNQRDLFPDQFLYVDLDRIHRGDHAPAVDEALGAAEESLDRALAVGDRFGAAVRERFGTG